MRRKELAGRTFGNLVVVDRAEQKHGKSYWNVICICGKASVVRGSRLLNGETISCGCYRNHGLAETPEYSAWADMRNRCKNSSHKHWNSYGGRGITICARWERFQNFYADMGSRPDGMTLDRIDNNGNYEPGNCRWATRLEQAWNRRTTRLLAINGVSKPISAWSRDFGIATGTICSRLNKGWAPVLAISLPPTTNKEKT